MNHPNGNDHPVAGAHGHEYFASAASFAARVTRGATIDGDDIMSSAHLLAYLDALVGHPRLADLSLLSVGIEDQRIYRAITSLLRNPKCRIHSLDLSGNVHNGDLLASGTIGMLRKLGLSYSRFTPQGWRAIEALLKDPDSKLEVLNLDNLGGTATLNEDVLARLASALTCNQRLRVLNLQNSWLTSSTGTWGRPTATTWEPFTNLLCDLTDINKTFKSNHTLQYLSGIHLNEQDMRPFPRVDDLPEHLSGLNERVRRAFLPFRYPDEEGLVELPGDLAFYLALNRMGDPGKVAIGKILKCHDDLDMTPLFQMEQVQEGHDWEFKMLPLVMEWLERADVVATAMAEAWLEVQANIPQRKLSAMYQFIRGLPDQFVEHYRGI